MRVRVRVKVVEGGGAPEDGRSVIVDVVQGVLAPTPRLSVRVRDWGSR